MVTNRDFLGTHVWKVPEVPAEKVKVQEGSDISRQFQKIWWKDMLIS